MGATALTTWRFTAATPSPSVGGGNEPGNVGPCTWDVSLDSGQVVARAMVQQGSLSPGFNLVALNSAAASLWNTLLVNNQKICFGSGTFNTLNGPWPLINNVFNLTISGVYGQTILQCNVPACIAVNLGNQNAVDAIYHAENITIQDVVMDGGGQSNSACLGVATALNVYVNHVILQNCYELGTGCLRVTNWNTQQILTHGFYMENSQLIKCKVTLSGLINGYLRNSNFVGLANGASGAKALIDFSKGDIVPTAVNNLANFCFCGNTISGWTLQIFAGFQAISNDTIGENTVRDANEFITVTDTAGGIYFEGLIVRSNYYSSSTGPFISLGYGHSINIVNNIVSFDTNAGASSTAIAIEKSIDPTVNQQPKNVAITNNEIYKWGGIGIDAGFIDGIISNNQIFDVNQANANQNSNAGISMGANLIGTLISGNSIISDVGSGAGASRPITYNGGVNVTITGNQLYYQACGLNVLCGIFLGATITKTTIIRNNFGYNPVGVIANPFLNSATTVGLSGTVASPTQGNTYTVVGVDIYVTSTGGSISVTIKDEGGNQIATGLTTLTDYFLPIGFTINWNTFSGATEVVVGI